MTQDLILHHYDPSPYSEKVRLFFGHKGLSWRSVQTPAVLPKPDLVALTGGYRRAPVLQIGADVYCDSALILAELERRFPTPGPLAGVESARAALLGHLVDVDLFRRVVRYVMGARADQLPQALLDDRAAMHADPRLERAALKAELPEVALQLQGLLRLLDQALAGADYYGGMQPANGDFAVYHALWFLQRVEGLTTLVPDATNLPHWLARMAAIGHGTRSEMSADEALALAAQATPAALSGGLLGTDLAEGQMVRVMPDGYPREAVCGRLLQADAARIVIGRTSSGGISVHVHFPRLGYRLVADQTV